MKRQEMMEKRKAEYAEQQNMAIMKQQIELVKTKRKILEKRKSLIDVSENVEEKEEPTIDTQFKDPSEKDIKELMEEEKDLKVKKED